LQHLPWLLRKHGHDRRTPRTLRHEYPGAVYHVMTRGDCGKAIFEGDDDRKAFLYRLGQVCGSHGWRIHAWVLIIGVRCYSK